MSIDQYSTTPANNDLTNYFKTGMRPSTVKNAGWDIMADVASYLVSLPNAGGAANALTVANGRPLGSLVPGLLQVLNPAAANTGSATFSPDGLAAANILANGAALAGGEMQPAVPALLKYDGTQWNLLNPRLPGKNLFVDPCCRVAQGKTGVALSTSYTYGLVDLVQCKAAGTAVSAGTIVQDSAASVALGATPYSCKLAGVTISGTGKVFFRRWIESRDAVALKNQLGLFSVICRHDAVGAINAFLTVNKFNSQDNLGAVTLIAQGVAVSVSSGVDTVVSLAIPNMGDCSNGIEVILEMDCGAVTTKDFYATDWQASVKTLAQVCPVPEFNDDLLRTMRYFESTYDYGTPPGTVSYTGGAITANGSANVNHIYLVAFCKAIKLLTPTVTIYSPVTGASGKMRDGNGATDVAAQINAAGLSVVSIQNLGTFNASDIFNACLTIDSRL